MKNIAFLTALIALSTVSASSQTTALVLGRTISLPGVTGKFDHFAIDLSGNRLFAAATGNHSVEVIDLATDKVEQSIRGLGKPHGLAWIESTHTLYVADGSRAELQKYEGTPLKLAGSVKLSDDADDLVYDQATQALYVGHGGSYAANPARVAVIDTKTFSIEANIPVATHPEALDIDSKTQRVFANIAESSEVAVIRAENNSVVAHWKLQKASDNVPIGFDAEQNVVFLACRNPAVVVVLDAATGNELSRLSTGSGADDLFYDAALRRIYVISGAGEVDSYQIDSEKQLHSLGVEHTATGAKTGLFVPTERLLYVGIPGATGQPNHPAEIRVYSTPSK